LAVGDIGEIIESVPLAGGYSPAFCHVYGDIYAFAYQDLADDLILKTFSIDAEGAIGAVIDTLPIDAGGYSPSIILAHAGMLAIAYPVSGLPIEGWCKTINVDNSGNLGAIQDSLMFEDSRVYPSERCLLHISGDVFAYVYQSGPGIPNLSVKTFDIDSEGAIGAVIDTLFPTLSGQSKGIDLIHCTGNLYALVYQQLYHPTFLHVFTISNDGVFSHEAPAHEVEDTYDTEGLTGSDYTVIYNRVKFLYLSTLTAVKVLTKTAGDYTLRIKSADGVTTYQTHTIEGADADSWIIFEVTELEIAAEDQYRMEVTRPAGKACAADGLYRPAGQQPLCSIFWENTKAGFGAGEFDWTNAMGFVLLNKSGYSIAVLNLSSSAAKPKILPIHGNVYAIAYYLGGGKLETRTISSEGVIGTKIDEVIIDGTSFGMINIYGNVYATTTTTITGAWVSTRVIGNDGTIGDAIGNRALTAIVQVCTYLTLLHCQGDIYACVLRATDSVMAHSLPIIGGAAGFGATPQEVLVKNVLI